MTRDRAVWQLVGLITKGRWFESNSRNQNFTILFVAFSFLCLIELILYMSSKQSFEMSFFTFFSFYFLHYSYLKKIESALIPE